jgi:hypothetical protein
MQKFAILCAAALAACATKSEDISASYVSPVAYSGLTCEQLADEAQAVSHRAAIATGQQDKARNKDIAKTTVGLVLFWPVLLFNEGDGVKAAEVASLKGQMQAIEQAATRKQCDFTFNRS